MATKADFTPEEWQILQWSITNTMTYVSMSDAGFWDSFKEATAAAKYIAAARTEGDNILVRDLAMDIKTKRDKEATSNPTTLADEVAERISEAVALVAAKDEADVEPFRTFILGLAEATAEAVKGVAPAEEGAIEKIKGALS